MATVVTAAPPRTSMVIPWTLHLGIDAERDRKLDPINQRLSQFLNVPIGRDQNGNCRWGKTARSRFDLAEHRTLRLINKAIKERLDQIVTFKDVRIINVVSQLPKSVIASFAPEPHAPGLSESERNKKRWYDGFAALMQLPHFLYAPTDVALKDRDLAVAQTLDIASIDNWCFIEHGRRSESSGLTLTLVGRDVELLGSQEETVIHRFEFLKGRPVAHYLKTNPRNQEADIRNRELSLPIHNPVFLTVLKQKGLVPALITAQLAYPKKEAISYAGAWSELWATVIKTILIVITILTLPFWLPFVCCCYCSD